VGSATDLKGVSHALLWTGTAGSAVDLNPLAFSSSASNGVAGGQQVGLASTGIGIWGVGRLGIEFGTTRAIVWTGSAASAVNLHNFLPAYFNGSTAQAIDDAGNIAGAAVHLSPSRYGFPQVGWSAILWTPVLPYGLEISEAGSPDPVPPGDPITYTITVTNSRSGTATGVIVTYLIPTGTTFVSATSDHGSCIGNSCDLGTLTGGSSGHVTLVVQLSSGFSSPSVSNGATVVADELMPRSATVITQVALPPPDLTGNWVSALQQCNAAKGRCSVNGRLNVINQGAGNAKGCVVRFYVSTDSVLSADDLLVRQVNLGALPAGQSKLTNVSFPIPRGTSASGKFVIAVLDADNAVTETNESNNNIVSARIP